MKTPTYRKEVSLIHTKFISCYIYYMNPGSADEPHYHDGVEIEYVIRGNSRTHKQGHLYFRKKGTVHEGINDSQGELVFFNITIPAESNQNTHYLK